MFGRPFVKRFALCYRTVVLSCLSVCLFVTFVHCGQTVGRIKMKLGTQVGLGPGHIVLDRDPAPPPPMGHSPPIFGPYLLPPNGCMARHVTWYGARPRPRPLCARWGPRSPPQKGGGAPKFSTNVYCVQTAGWIRMVLGTEVGLSLGDIVLNGDPATPEKGTAPPNFWPVSVVAKRGWMDQDASWYGGKPRPRRHCVRWGRRSP